MQIIFLFRIAFVKVDLIVLQMQKIVVARVAFFEVEIRSPARVGREGEGAMQGEPWIYPKLLWDVRGSGSCTVE